jgi:cell wall-associated NlpC family hydrolase
MKIPADVCKALEALPHGQEANERTRVVAEACDWVGTPFVWQQRVKGPKGGADCGTFLAAVYEAAGIFRVDAKELRRADGERIGAQWNQNQDDEIYLRFVLKHASEIVLAHMHEQTQENIRPGDLALVKVGRCWAHGAIVTAWPKIIHNYGQTGVLPASAATNEMWLGQPIRFFSPWGVRR